MKNLNADIVRLSHEIVTVLLMHEMETTKRDYTRFFSLLE